MHFTKQNSTAITFFFFFKKKPPLAQTTGKKIATEWEGSIEHRYSKKNSQPGTNLPCTHLPPVHRPVKYLFRPGGGVVGGQVGGQGGEGGN